MRVKSYDVLHRAIEEGITYGWNRAHKHVEDPEDDAVKAQLMTCIMTSIAEYFDFQAPDGD